MSLVSLSDVAPTIRSKNAGVDEITFDIIFQDEKTYELVRDTEAITRADIVELYDVSSERISAFVYFDPANALKFTIRRERPSGSPGEHDIMGAQLYPPLFDLRVPSTNA